MKLKKKFVTKMVKMSLDGIGARTISKKLNEQGIPTKGRKSYNNKNGITIKNKLTGEKAFKDKDLITWRAGTVLGQLKNTIHKGEYNYLNEVVKVPAIIDENTWQKVQDNLKKNKKYSKRNNKVHFYLLQGLLICGRCGKTIIGRIQEDKKFRMYFCMSKQEDGAHFCGMKSINISQLNDLVWKTLLSLLTESSLIRKAIKQNFSKKSINLDKIDKEILGLKNQLEALPERKDTLIRLLTTSRISESLFDKHSSEIESLKKDLENRIKINLDSISFSKKQKSAYASDLGC